MLSSSTHFVSEPRMHCDDGSQRPQNYWERFSLERRSRLQGGQSLKISFLHCLLFQAELPDGRQIPALLLANKSDLRHREVRTDQVFLFNCSSSIASVAKVAALHKLHGFLGWAEVSAKDDHMLRETVTFLVDAMVSKCGLSKGLVLN